MTTYDDDMPIYISIYDRPKRGKGRPLSCTLTDEEKKERARVIASKHYYDNYEQTCAKHTIDREEIRKNKKYKLFLKEHLKNIF